MDALAIQYPKPSGDYATEPPPDSLKLGIRIGIVARESDGEAWAAAHARFPVDRKGQLTRQLALKVSDSEWHRQIAGLGGNPGDAPDNPYWTLPFENYHTSCPYLVGSHERVADEIARYAGAGYRTIIVDVPQSAEELHHIGVACRRATERVSA
jgi:alkanesulfonate monooxygenase